MRVIDSVRKRIETLGKLGRRPFLLRVRGFKLAAVLACLLIVLVSLGLFVKGAAGLSLVRLPSLSDHGLGIQIFDRYDKLICSVQKEECREPVPIDRMSKDIREAMVAAEDHNFYSHHGVDPFGVGRALFANVKARRIVQGGSTITQQLVKTLYLDRDDRSVWRKLKEMAMSVDVDTGYSKNKILETYLNQVYFGQGAYGIERAARTYFNKGANRLSLSESAFLAGLVKAPSELGRPERRTKAYMRQHQVLDSMVESGSISEPEAASAKMQMLVFQSGPHPLKHPYYVSHVIDIVQDEVRDTKLWGLALRVYTNLDPQAQAAAEATLAKGIKTAPAGVEQGALASISVPDGAVIALVGGVGNYENHQFNRAVNPHTAGSAFKPFVYLAALDAGVIGPNSIVDDSPIVVPNPVDGTTYSPRNFDGGYMGLMTVRDALALSRNVCAVVVGQQAGLDNVITTARAAGISSVMDPFPSLPLGTCAVSPLEMASAFGTLARSGVYIEPQFIRRIDGPDGIPVKTYHSEPQPVLPAETVNQLVDVLQDVVTRGTGKRAALPGIAVAGKTGTADQSRDIWFIGATPDVVTAVWGGNDDNRPIPGHHVTGGSVMAGIWHDYMSKYYMTHPRPVVAFAPPTVPLARDLPLPGMAAQLAGQAVEGVEEVVQGAAQRLNHRPRGWLRKLVSGLKNWF